jgi:hypothetical protein
MRSDLIALLTILLTALPPALAEDRASAGDAALERICTLVDPGAALGPEIVESTGETTDARCEAVLSCLPVSRSGGESASETQHDLESMCRDVLALSPDEIRALLDDLSGDEAPSADTGAVEGRACTRFLRCVASLTEENPTAPGQAAETATPEASRDTSATGAWREEFARLCGATQTAASLTRPELEKLLPESDALLERIRGFEIPEAKVYTFRLEKCRAFLEYSLDLLDSRTDEGGGL